MQPLIWSFCKVLTSCRKSRTVLPSGAVLAVIHPHAHFPAPLPAAILVFAASPYPEKTPDTPGNKLLDRYLAGQAREIALNNGVSHIESAEDWKAKAPEYRRQMFEMLGLDPCRKKRR
jgi:hypothetical protein